MKFAVLLSVIAAAVAAPAQYAVVAPQAAVPITYSSSGQVSPFFYTANSVFPNTFAASGGVPASYSANSVFPSTFAASGGVPASYSANSVFPSTFTAAGAVPTSYTANSNTVFPSTFAASGAVPTSYTAYFGKPTFQQQQYVASPNVFPITYSGIPSTLSVNQVANQFVPATYSVAPVAAVPSVAHVGVLPKSIAETPGSRHINF